MEDCDLDANPSKYFRGPNGVIEKILFMKLKVAHRTKLATGLDILD